MILLFRQYHLRTKGGKTVDRWDLLLFGFILIFRKEFVYG